MTRVSSGSPGEDKLFDRFVAVVDKLGARRGNLPWLVLRQAGIMLLIGIAAGTVLALSSARILTSYLYGVSADDAWTLTGAAALLFISGITAAWIPARRAARVDPVEALRAE